MENVNVRNRNNGSTGYTIPDSGVRRLFQPGELKKIPIEELKQLQYIPGGDYLLQNYLIVEDKEALDILNMSNVEPEYFYTEDEIRKLLSEGSLDQLEDALNFAPSGVVDLIKDIAIKTQLPDTNKRDLISKKTGLNISNAIYVNKVMDEETETAEADTKTRKAAPITADAAPARKTAAPKYKVVSAEK